MHYASHLPRSLPRPQGEETTTITNNGATLQMVVRGIKFSGPDFDSFSPLEPGTAPASAALPLFTLHRGDLCACYIECAMPLPVVINGVVQPATLRMRLRLGEPDTRGILDETLQLDLVLPGCTFSSHPRHDLFEDALNEIQGQLPAATFTQCCWNCAFSDYSPAGHGLFGGLACFRDNRADYRLVYSKSALFKIWDSMTQWVQETYLCPEFERRLPGTGYRG